MSCCVPPAAALRPLWGPRAHFGNHWYRGATISQCFTVDFRVKTWTRTHCEDNIKRLLTASAVPSACPITPTSTILGRLKKIQEQDSRSEKNSRPRNPR